MLYNSIQTAETVSEGHPDKACDFISDSIHDALMDLALKNGLDPSSIRAAIETSIKGSTVFVSGEYAGTETVLKALDVEGIVTKAWQQVGYGHTGTPIVLNHLDRQAPEIARLVDGDGAASGAGDQGIMVGHAVADNSEYMPAEYVAARDLLTKLSELRRSGKYTWLRSDAKSQVSLGPNGEVRSVVISTQHDETIDLDTLRETVFEQVVVPILGDVTKDRVKLNAKGSFILGGAMADAGLTGRKIVVDAYGPSYSVGGGAFSGKDASKVDRSAAYMARRIAKTALATEFLGAKHAIVQLAYGIGQTKPEAISGHLSNGQNITGWINDVYPDLSPQWIQDFLGLWDRDGWNYRETASGGHFGRSQFPWESISLP